MSHPATFFPVQLIEQVRTCWSRDEDVSGLEYRRYNDDDIKGITDVWLELKWSNQHEMASSWLNFIQNKSSDLFLATLLRIAEEVLMWHETSEESYTNVIQLLVRFVEGQFETKQWVCSMGNNHCEVQVGEDSLRFKNGDCMSCRASCSPRVG